MIEVILWKLFEQLVGNEKFEGKLVERMVIKIQMRNRSREEKIVFTI